MTTITPPALIGDWEISANKIMMPGGYTPTQVTNVPPVNVDPFNVPWTGYHALDFEIGLGRRYGNTLPAPYLVYMSHCYGIAEGNTWVVGKAATVEVLEAQSKGWAGSFVAGARHLAAQTLAVEIAPIVKLETPSDQVADKVWGLAFGSGGNASPTGFIYIASNSAYKPKYGFMVHAEARSALRDDGVLFGVLGTQFSTGVLFDYLNTGVSVAYQRLGPGADWAWKIDKNGAPHVRATVEGYGANEISMGMVGNGVAQIVATGSTIGPAGRGALQLIVTDSSGGAGRIPFEAGSDGSAITRGARRKQVTVVTTSPFTVTKSHHILGVNKAIGSPTVINLPVSAVDGEEIEVKDCRGDAATHAITIVGSIDGDASYEINSNYGSWRGVYMAGAWRTLN